MTTSHTITLNGLIKVGKSSHIDQLQQEGLIYCNTLKYFRDIESSNKERHDGREGANSSIKGGNLQIFIPGRKDPLPVQITKSHLNTYDDSTLMTHLYCLYAITPKHITGKPFIDEKNIGFGEKALLLTRPLEFIERIKKAISQNIKCYYDLVDYYDDNETHEHLTVFQKPNQFEHQNEFRFHFKGHIGDTLEVRIGSIEDISQRLDSKLLTQVNLRKMEQS